MLYSNETKSLASALDDTPDIYYINMDDAEAMDAALQETLDEDREDSFGINKSDNNSIDAEIVVGNPLELPQSSFPIL